MKLPIPFFNSKSDDSDYYLALLLTEDKASAVILKATEDKLKPLNTHSEFFPESIEHLTLEEIITTVDKTISRAEEVLPPQIETHKTVFGVKDKWVDRETKKIKKEYLDKLKKVCDALDLSPIGFMVTTEAITHLVEDEEGAPVSAVFAEIGEKQIVLSLLRGGKVVETISSTLMHSAPHTVDKLLSHFTVPVLPARIILYLNKPDEDTNQAFISHQWSKSLPFLHVPQVTVLPAHFDTRSLTYGAATQMGFTVSEPHHEALPKLTKEEKKEEEAIADEVQEPENETLEKDSEQMEENPSEENEPRMDNIAPVPAAEEKSGDFGFVVDGEPVAQKAHHEPVEHHAEVEHEAHGHTQHHETHHRDDDDDERPRKSSNLADKVPFLSSLSLPKNVKMPNVGGLMNSVSGKKAPIKIILPIVALLIIIIGTSFYYINIVKATVSLSVKPNIVNEQATVTFSSDESNNFSSNVIAARSISASIQSEISGNATGKKDVGEKAKGTVTFFNNDNDPVTLSSGAEIRASNGEVFLLDKEAKIPAATGDIFTGTKPGNADASVTAKDLGTEGNVPSGTRFTVGSASTLAARNDNAFSGGTTKNVTVVSKSDLDKLRTDILKKGQAEAQSKLAEEAESGETVLPVVSSPSLENATFDKKEGDEATKVTLKGNVVYQGLAYSNDDLKEYGLTVLKAQYADDVTFDEKSVKGSVEDVSLEDPKTAEASVTVEGGQLPEMDTNDIIKNVKDQSLGQARETISNLPQVTKTDITFSPPIFIIPDLFPRLPNQINVEIKTE